MKKILLLFFYLSFYTLYAQIHIGASGGTSINNIFPCYDRAGYSYTQQIVLASEYQAEDGTSGPITQIKWKITNGAVDASNFNNWSVYLGHTTKTSFSSASDFIPLGNLTSVYSGIVTITQDNQWITIDLPTSFNYNTSENLVVAVLQNVAGSSSPSFSAYTPITFEYRGILAYDTEAVDINNLTTSYFYYQQTIAQIQFTGTQKNCSRPQNVIVSNSTNGNVTLDWSNQQDALDGYFYELRTSGLPGSGGSGLVESGNIAAGVVSKTHNNPPLNTELTYYIKALCSTNEESYWSKVVFTIIAPPKAAANQGFCINSNATLNNLSVKGENIKWYGAATGGNALINTTVLTNNTTYYASQTVNGVESIERVPVQVTLNIIPNSPVVTSPYVYTNINATLATLTTSAANPKWYVSNGAVFSLSSGTVLNNGQTYYVSENNGGCESPRTAVTVQLDPNSNPCVNWGTAPNQDYDCDGVINSVDLDDDNDGILDDEERDVSTTATVFNLFAPPAEDSMTKQWNINISGAAGTEINFRNTFYTIPNSGALTINVPQTGIPIMQLNTVENNKSYTLSATGPVTIVQELRTSRPASDSWIVLPEKLWGTEYRLFTDTQRGNYQYAAIYSNIDNNQIIIKNKEGLLQKTFTLNIGQTYLQGGYKLDMTGWTISSTQPLGVIVGVDVARNPSGGGENLNIMLLPTNQLGTKHYIPNNNPNTTYVMAEEPNTEVRIDGVLISTLVNSGDVYDFNIGVNDLKILETSKKVTVWQVTPNNDDPSWLNVLDANKAVTGFNFTTPSSMIYSNVLALIANTASTSLIRVNGAAITGWVPFPSDPSSSLVKITNIVAGQSITVNSTTNQVPILSAYTGIGDVISNATSPSIGSYNLGTGNAVNLSDIDTDGDGIFDHFDLDSDNDGCSDANEAYNSKTAEGPDGNMIYGDGNPPPVDSHGKVIGANYSGTNPNVRKPGKSSSITAQPEDAVSDVSGSVSYNVSITAGSGTTLYQWQYSTDKGITWNDLVDTPVYSGTTTPTLVLTNIPSSHHNYSYRVVINQSDFICGEVFSDAANLCLVTTSQAQIVNDKCAIIEIAGNVPVLGTGSWSIVSGSGGTITDVNEAETFFNGIPGTTYVLRWTITNGSCSNFSDVTISNIQAALNSVPAQVDVLCQGSATGSARATITGGAAPYSFVWNNGITSTTNEAVNLNEGTYEVTVTDDNGCVIKQKFIIVVTPDIISPTVVTQNITIHLDATGKAVITASQIDNGSTDNCAIATRTLDKTTFDCTNIGGNSVILTVTDSSGNSDTATATVTVQDKIKPTVVAQNITVQLDITGKAVITASQIDNGSTDNCTIATMTLDKTTFDCTNIGRNSVILTVTDVNGNSDTATATVTVEDKIKPTVVTQNITVQLDVTGKAVIIASQIDNGSTDNCAIATRTLDKTTFDCTNIGRNSVILTVTDTSGNLDTAIATVTVEDKIKPTVVTKNITVQLDATGKAVVTASQMDNGSTDNCAIATRTLDKTTFDCTNIGRNSVILTVTDFNGNSDTATATVTVEDKIKPTVVAQNITVQLDITGKALIIASQIDNGSTDNCAIATMTLDKTTFNCTNIGNNSVTLTVTDVNGNSDTATATVTVQDKIKPTVVAQDITIQLDATGKAVITASQIDNGSTDNCTIATMILDKTTFDCTNIGGNSVTLTVTDVNGNSDTATATVTVEDKIKPTVVAQNITVQLDATGKAVIIASQIDNGSTDNCAIATMTLDKTTFDCTNIGSNSVILTVTDVNGNSDTAIATVTFEDRIKPTVVTQNITIQLDITGKALITASQIDNGSTDNCAIARMTIDKTTFNCTNIGNNSVILTVTDVNGNSDTATATVTVEDKIKPTVVTKNITVQLDATGKAVITASQIDNGSTDNCAIATRTLDKTTFDCTNIGNNSVILTVTDVNGNSDTATATVTVEDKIKPTVVAQNITVQLDITGKALIIASQIDNGSTDNCAIATMTLDKTTFDCTNIGGNSVILTVTDVNGNSDKATATVTVQDKIKPTVVTQNITIQLDATGKAVIRASQIDNGSTDNCAIATMTLDKTTFDCTNIGSNSVILRVTDVNGNSDTATATVTVHDKIKPTVVAQNITVQLDATGKALIRASQIDNGSTDNCAIATMTLDKTTFDCTNIGGNSVTLRVTDVNGNSDTATATVTVEDKIKPTVVAQNITVQLDITGKAVITASQIDNGSTDNCTIAKMTLDKTTFDCTNIGGNSVTLTVTDTSGNSDTKAVIVTIEKAASPNTPNLLQKFCAIDQPLVSDISIPYNVLNWFADPLSTPALLSQEVLRSGIYYAEVSINACNTSRIPVTIMVNDEAAPSGNAIQYFCREKETVISDLITNEKEILWYDSASGGIPLDSDTLLEDKHKYYASYFGAECESTKRFEVQVIFNYCDVIVKNGISANGDGKNDYLAIEGVLTFADNQLEIFNTSGSLVYSVTHYGQGDNLFRGFANKGLGHGKGLLPFGTYYYIFSFTNNENKRVTKKGFLHLNP